MKKLLLASVLAIASFPGYAADNNEIKADDAERLDDCVLGRVLINPQP
jgi:hypothetical protein